MIVGQQTGRVCVHVEECVCVCMYMYDVLVEIVGRDKKRRE